MNYLVEEFVEAGREASLLYFKLQQKEINYVLENVPS